MKRKCLGLVTKLLIVWLDFWIRTCMRLLLFFRACMRLIFFFLKTKYFRTIRKKTPDFFFFFFFFYKPRISLVLVVKPEMKESGTRLASNMVASRVGSGSSRTKTISAQDDSAETPRPIFQSGTARTTFVGRLGPLYYFLYISLNF